MLDESSSATISFDMFIPFINKIKEDKSVFIIKVDGERDEDIYTIICSGSLLGDEGFLRIDTSDLEGGISYICCEYARIVWNW